MPTQISEGVRLGRLNIKLGRTVAYAIIEILYVTSQANSELKRNCFNQAGLLCCTKSSRYVM